MPVEVCITIEGDTIATTEKFNSVEEAVAYLYGKALNGSLRTAHTVSIYQDKEDKC